MNKLLLLICFLFMKANLFAQDINISFEAEEGFQLGEINGQNDWFVSGSIFSHFINVVDDKATEGLWSLNLEGDPNGPLPDNLLGIVVSPILSNDNKNEFSVDLYIEADQNLNSSEFNLGTEATSQNMLSSRVAFINGEILIVDINPANPQQIVFIPVVDYPTNTWFEFKVLIKSNNDQIQYFLDDDLIYVGEIFGPDKFDAFFFASSFNQTGVYIDNINITEETMSVEEASFESFSFYPNPTKDVINIQLNNNQAIQQLEVFDVTGRSVLTSKNPESQLDVRHLKSGNYILKVQLENSYQSFKFIKE